MYDIVPGVHQEVIRKIKDHTRKGFSKKLENYNHLALSRIAGVSFEESENR